MSEKYEQLRGRLAEIASIEQALSVLNWDRETQMPPGGAESRANQIATLTGIQHERATSDELGRLLEDLASGNGFDSDSDEARIVKVTKRDYDLECKLPARLVEELSRASSAGLEAWHKAKEAKDYSQFEPFLKRNVELTRELADTLGYEKRPYDALLDRFEPDMTTDQLETIFSELKAAIVPLVRDIAANQDAVDDSILHQQYDEEKQLKLSLEIAERFGYDLKRGRMDKAAHPFATSFGIDDVRITTRVFPDFLSACLFATLHESGHAMYEQGVGKSLSNTGVAQGASPGVHESQSRLWENLVGRSRPFQSYLFPRLQETFPQQLGGTDVETFYRAINKVYPSLIRVEADEVTYNLHIMLRFELENEILEGKLGTERLDEVWKERMDQYLGVTPEHAGEGVLQDIHWSFAGSFGVFPGYTLGNIIGAQLFRKAHEEMPDLDDQISRGEFANLHSWLQSNLYAHGRKFTPNELLQRITGEPLGTQAWIEYVRGKFSDIYAL